MGDSTRGRKLNPRLRHAIAAFIDTRYIGLDDDIFDMVAIKGIASPASAGAQAPAGLDAQAPIGEGDHAPIDAGAQAPTYAHSQVPASADRGFFGSVKDALSSVKPARRSEANDVLPREYRVEETQEAVRCEPPRPESFDFGMHDAMPLSTAAPDSSEGLSSWLEELDEPFSTTLLELIDRKGLSDVEVYRRANMSRQLFSRIRSNPSYRPTKKTVLALGIAMELSLAELTDLLERAGFALSHASKRDLIVEYFVTKGMYDVFVINEALYEFDQPLL